MSEQTTETSKTYMLGQAFAIMDSIPLFGDNTFELTREMAEFITGLKAPCETEPNVRMLEYLAYVKWTSAVAIFAAPCLMRQIRQQYPEARILETMGGFCTDGDIGARLEELHHKANADGVFFDRELRFEPLSDEEKTEAADYFVSKAFHEECHKQVLTAFSKVLTA